MRILVDRGKCCGHARCNAKAPDLFALDDLGYVSVDELEVPEGEEGSARAAAAACPERAITVR